MALSTQPVDLLRSGHSAATELHRFMYQRGSLLSLCSSNERDATIYANGLQPPRGGLLRELRREEHPTTGKVSPLGVKGMGESDCTASIPSLSVQHLAMPRTPTKRWRAMQVTKQATN